MLNILRLDVLRDEQSTDRWCDDGYSCSVSFFLYPSVERCLLGCSKVRPWFQLTFLFISYIIKFSMREKRRTSSILAKQNGPLNFSVVGVQKALNVCRHLILLQQKSIMSSIAVNYFEFCIRHPLRQLFLFP